MPGKSAVSNHRLHKPIVSLIVLIAITMTLTLGSHESDSTAAPFQTNSDRAQYTIGGLEHAVASQGDAANGCPVTVRTNGFARDQPGNYGNGRIWTNLPPLGRLGIGPSQQAPDGYLHWKFGWWRGPGIRGDLTIEGQRLDAPAPPLEAEIPDGYGNSGFQASGLVFPTDGCWEVTARADDASLSFVVLVVKG